MYFSANGAEPFVTSGKNLTGPNKIVKFDTNANAVSYIADLATFQQEAQATYGQVITGFQDMAEDEIGNSYAVASYGSGLAKITPDGTVSVFFVRTPANGTLFGYSGLAAVGSSLIVADELTGGLFKFDTTAATPTAQSVTISGLAPASTFGWDAVYAPPKYDGKVLLVSDDTAFSNEGGIAVFKSADCWNSAKFLGYIQNNNPLANGSTPTATVQIAESIYISEEFFFDTGVFDVPGTRSSFPFIDITQAVQNLVFKF